MIIHVTQEDIDKGLKGIACNCPIALAIKRALKADISINQTMICINGKIENIDIPESVSTFIELFDSLLPKQVEPFSFELDYNPPS